MDDLGKEIALLDEQLSGLFADIDPVIQKVPSAAAEAGDKSEILGDSALGHGINLRASSIRNLRFRVQDIRNQIAL